MGLHPFVKCKVSFPDGSVASELELKHVRPRNATAGGRGKSRGRGKAASATQDEFAEGAAVDVAWSDGMTYPGTFVRCVVSSPAARDPRASPPTHGMPQPHAHTHTHSGAVAVRAARAPW